MSEFLKFVRNYWRYIISPAMVFSAIIGFNVYIVHLANSQPEQCENKSAD